MSERAEPYFDVDVQLSGVDGNAMAIMASVSRALRRAGASLDDIALYREESMSGNYEYLLQTAMRWVNVS